MLLRITRPVVEPLLGNGNRKEKTFFQCKVAMPLDASNGGRDFLQTQHQNQKTCM